MFDFDFLETFSSKQSQIWSFEIFGSHLILCSQVALEETRKSR